MNSFSSMLSKLRGYPDHGPLCRFTAGLLVIAAMFVFPVPMGGFIAAVALVFGPWVVFSSYIQDYHSRNSQLGEYALIIMFLTTCLLMHAFISPENLLAVDGSVPSQTTYNFFVAFVSLTATMTVGLFAVTLVIVVCSIVRNAQMNSWDDDTGNKRSSGTPKPPRPLPTDAVDSFFKNLEENRMSKNTMKARQPELMDA